MKLAARKASTPRVQLRDQRQADRNRAPPLREEFPELAQLRVELYFADSTRPAPSSQSHTLYPAARAYFRFACPCFDCNGEFDLGAEARALAAASGPRQRETRGALECVGVRSHDQRGGVRCPIQLQFRIGITANSASRGVAT